MAADSPHLNLTWSSLIVAELIRNGITEFCISPGSRSTPLTLAIAQNPRARQKIFYDERGAAFYALGYARAAGKPAVLVCTSGTAVANYFPAIVEASVDFVPMLVLTADRPPELLQSGANQTIDQVGIFGEYVRWFFNFPCPDESIEAAFVLTTVDQACWRAQGSAPGPVHLNCNFREPLAPTDDSQDRKRIDNYLKTITSWQKNSEPRTTYHAPVASASTQQIADLSARMAGKKGLLIIGQLSSTQERAAVVALNETLQWMTFADVTSGLRGKLANEIPCYDILLSNHDFKHCTRPEFIVQIGTRLISKRLAAFLRDAEPDLYLLLARQPSRHDPDHRISHRLVGEIDLLCRALCADLPPAPTNSDKHLALIKEAAAAIEKISSQSDAINEPGIADVVAKGIPPEAGLWLANSMPVRDMDMFAHSTGTEHIAANRGASGIDGTLASAAGFACGLQKPVTLISGDLSFLHDLNSLAVIAAAAYPVIIIVINNDGGGIFSFLPIAENKKHFESCFGTPHGLTFPKAASLFNLPYFSPTTLPAFQTCYAQIQKKGISAVIEVHTNRPENAALHKEILRCINKLRCIF